MDNRLKQAVFAVQMNQLEQARHLLGQLLQAEPRNALAWVWLAKTVCPPQWQRTCLDRVLAYNPFRDRISA